MMKALAPLVAAAAVALTAAAQPYDSNQPDRTIDAAVRAQVIDGAIAALEKSYVFPEAARRITADLREREKAGDYAAINGAKAFARQLTQDLQAVSRDKHLRIVYRARALPRPDPAAPAPEQAARRDQFLRSINYGFEKVERLKGNIGYLDLRSFQGDGPEAEEVADAAMTMVARTEALVIDLRHNGGGSPYMVARVSSYLFDKPTHLNDLYWRERDRTDEFWTAREVPGKRFGASKPVFVLTSKRTFSGAEEFAYNLQTLKRATIVGETTGGGAHPGGSRWLHEHFEMFVPTGRAINPITRTNWEGTGVTPDVEVPADRALERALELAADALQR